MVFLAITPTGLHQAIEISKTSPLAIWCGADAVTESNYENLHGLNISRFTYALGGEALEIIREALETISEHHPDEIIWVENNPGR